MDHCKSTQGKKWGHREFFENQISAIPPPLGNNVNPPLSARTKEEAAHWAAFSFWRREASRLRGLRGDSKGAASGGPDPNLLTASAAQRQSAARRGRARVLL